MNKRQRADIIIKKLESLYPSPKIPLRHINSFTFLIAVMLSAQSTDKKVNEVTEDLFPIAYTPQLMHSLGIDGIYSYIKQLGLAKQKSKYAYLIAEKLILSHSSKIPDSLNKLESLPGVGHKTASVVISQVFGVPSFPVDTHIHRLAQRWGLTSGTSVKTTEADLKMIFPKSLWNKLHLQIIYYGREYCTARGCNGMVCSLCKQLYPKRDKAVITKKA
ncbi:endonuclease III domain-containing protein [Prochlorococcus marinus]|uniref:Endonuclease III n=1 Tax=Prochlorococcus marinus (strain MIT 9211) TaxID=93059 RepID=A9BAM7_PROM4|nr:endonuclease III [Prochlorococcus marinus]ABX08889.1 putative endonuclease [Prochlorococcus marinus str. MIT 9211]